MRAQVILLDVEYFFSGLLVLMTVVITWFAGYVVYRLYTDER
jgi:hypothetical protein